MILRAVRLEMLQTVRPMRNGKPSFLTRSRGFTYIGVIAILAVMMIAMGAVAQIWHTQMQREKEQELLFIGNQFQNAIGRFYQESGRAFPTSLQALLGVDGDTKLNKRYLRRMYIDPFTGKDTWGLVLGANGEIVGVHSLSDMETFKRAGFSEKNSAFEGKTKYSEWQFVFVPQKAQGTAATGDTVNGIPRPVPRSGNDASDVVNGNTSNTSPNTNTPISLRP
jgi:type II secretory pathway pseudopilin PulG